MNMLRTFEINGIKFVNYDLDDTETISFLKREYGITDEQISEIKNTPITPSEIDMLGRALVELELRLMQLEGGT